MTNVIQKIAILMQKRDSQEKDQKRLKDLKECDNIITTKTIIKEFPRQESYKDYLSSRWYVLYCNSCNRVCHRDCKGKNEGYHKYEYGCIMITILRGICKKSECLYSKHSFHDYIEKTRTVNDKIVDYIKVEDPKKKLLKRKKKAKGRNKKRPFKK